MSVYDRSRLDTEHVTRSQATEKALDASNHIPTSNPEPTNIPDQHKLISDSKGKMLVLTAEGYRVTSLKSKWYLSISELKSANRTF